MLFLSPSKLIIRFITPLVWRFSENRKIASLQTFAMVEKDSAGQLLQCALKVNHPAIKAALFQHVLEEFKHADIFNNLANTYSEQFLLEKIPPRVHLASRSSSDLEIIEAYAYSHIGECEVNKDFIHYSKGKFDINIKRAFGKIAADENRHAHSTEDILIQLMSNNNNRKLILLKSYWKYKFEKYKTFMHKLSNTNLSLILMSIYFLLGPFIKRNLVKRLELNPDDQIHILKKQIESLKEYEG